MGDAEGPVREVALGLAGRAALDREMPALLPIFDPTQVGEVTDVGRLLTAVVASVGVFGAAPWWRGEPEEYQTALLPGMFRRDGSEADTLLLFRQGAYSRATSLPEQSDLAGWLFLMQHHGLPTRLLDWSTSPLAALYFAACAAPEKPGVLWCVSPTGLNKEMGVGETQLLPHHAEVSAIVRRAFNQRPRKPLDSPKVLAIIPHEVDLKVMLQGGRFTVHDEGTALGLGGPAQPGSYLRKWVVPAGAKKQLLAVLGALGVRRSTLFPDLVSLAADLTSFRYGKPSKNKAAATRPPDEEGPGAADRERSEPDQVEGPVSVDETEPSALG